jgi:dolichol-phosphate mannosyltransferase
MLSKGGNLYARLLLRLPVRDLTGGIKAWRRDVLAALDLSQANASGYAFQIQTTLQASLLPTTIVEVPIHFSERRAGTSKMTPGIALEAVLRVWTMRRHVRSAVSRSPEPTT